MPDRNHGIGDEEAFIDRVADPLRAIERVDVTFSERVMSAVRAEVRERSVAPEHRPATAPRRWWRRSLTLRFTPIGALATAAAIVALAFIGARAVAVHRGPVSGLASTRQDTVYVIRFVLAAPAARNVVVVGDFNNWNRSTTALTPSGNDGLWSAAVALPPGRHEYAFIVDGEHWTADPQAAVTIHDDFGTASSVVTVGTHAS
jgi:hypothetical protein